MAMKCSFGEFRDLDHVRRGRQIESDRADGGAGFVPWVRLRVNTHNNYNNTITTKL